MRRRLFTLGAALSLLLFLATVVLIVYSFFVGEDFSSGTRVSELEAIERRVMVTRGIIWMARFRLDVKADEGLADALLLMTSKPMPRHSMTPAPRIETTFGFSWERSHAKKPLSTSTEYSMDSTTVTFPLWLPALLFAHLPCLWLSRRIVEAKRHRRRLRGQCLRCVYALNFNVSGTCPECGNRFKPASPRSD